MSFRDDGEDVIASSTLSEEKIAKLVEPARQLGVQGTASLVVSRKLAGKLRFADTAVMGRFGRAAL